MSQKLVLLFVLVCGATAMKRPTKDEILGQMEAVVAGMKAQAENVDNECGLTPDGEQNCILDAQAMMVQLGKEVGMQDFSHVSKNDIVYCAFLKAAENIGI